MCFVFVTPDLHVYVYVHHVKELSRAMTRLLLFYALGAFHMSLFLCLARARMRSQKWALVLCLRFLLPLALLSLYACQPLFLLHWISFSMHEKDILWLHVDFQFRLAREESYILRFPLCDYCLFHLMHFSLFSSGLSLTWLLCRSPCRLKPSCPKRRACSTNKWKWRRCSWRRSKHHKWVVRWWPFCFAWDMFIRARVAYFCGTPALFDFKFSRGRRSTVTFPLFANYRLFC